MLLSSLPVQIEVAHPGALSSVWWFCKLLGCGVLLNRHGRESVPVLLMGRLWCSGFGQSEDWVALGREKLEGLLEADGFRSPLEDSSCIQMLRTCVLSVSVGCRV